MERRYKITKSSSTKYPNHIQIFDTIKNQISCYVDIFEFNKSKYYQNKYPNYVILKVYKIMKEIEMGN